MSDPPFQSKASTSRSFLLPSNPVPPAKILVNDQIVGAWHQSPGFLAFNAWLRRRCERIKGKDIMVTSYEGSSKPIRNLMDMLEKMMDWAEEVPPLPPSGQRFGNLAFRSYVKLVDERLPPLIHSFEPPPNLISQLLPLWLNSYAFGHPTRMDYGTGHELAFVIGLWCCVVSGWVGGEGKEDEEDELILRVFTKYTDLVTLLQSRYRLEPAGSHGVWGLDDYSFLPYLFGAAQLLDTGVTPSQTLDNALSPSPTIKDLYTLSLTRVKLFKHGASFSEHSPMLHSLSLMPSFSKPFSGLLKMFQGEVVGKRVVVQGLWVGGWVWGEDVPKDVVREAGSDRVAGVGVGTEAPWASRRSGRQGVLDATRGVWQRV